MCIFFLELGQSLNLTPQEIFDDVFNLFLRLIMMRQRHFYLVILCVATFLQVLSLPFSWWRACEVKTDLFFAASSAGNKPRENISRWTSADIFTAAAAIAVAAPVYLVCHFLSPIYAGSSSERSEARHIYKSIRHLFLHMKNMKTMEYQTANLLRIILSPFSLCPSKKTII